MAGSEREETFKVTDRRRRSLDDDVPAPRAPEPPREAPAEVDDEGENLTGLFSMLANSAAMALNDGDLPQTAELLEVLVLLRKKTEGNRTVEETQVLDDLIDEVQRRYVEVTKRSG